MQDVTQSELPPLPALRHLGDLADIRPCIIVDNREQTPLTFTRLPSVKGTLQSGDYSAVGIEHLFAVERKSVQDIVSCCVGESRERFERELHRLRGFRFKRLLIVGTHTEIEQGRYRSNVKPSSVLHSLGDASPVHDGPSLPPGFSCACCMKDCSDCPHAAKRRTRGKRAFTGSPCSKCKPWNPEDDRRTIHPPDFFWTNLPAKLPPDPEPPESDYCHDMTPGAFLRAVLRSLQG